MQILEVLNRIELGLTSSLSAGQARDATVEEFVYLELKLITDKLCRGFRGIRK